MIERNNGCILKLISHLFCLIFERYLRFTWIDEGGERKCSLGKDAFQVFTKMLAGKHQKQYSILASHWLKGKDTEWVSIEVNQLELSTMCGSTSFEDYARIK